MFSYFNFKLEVVILHGVGSYFLPKLNYENVFFFSFSAIISPLY